MNIRIIQNTGLFLLALVFSIGLMFAFTELPRLLDQFLASAISTPHEDPAYSMHRIELFYQAYHIRLIGYICLGVIAALVVAGFTTRRDGWALAGSAALFLPVFATFAHSMFYLAGLGLLNVIMFPFMDISLKFVDLGKVVLIPYWLLMKFFGLFGWYARSFITYTFMGVGAFIFTLSVFVWLQSRYRKDKIATHWIYRFSRHPQYLGWILWSYGLMLYGPSLNQMKKTWGWFSTLPWMLSTLVILGICLMEELKMSRVAGKDYDAYRSSTPFMFPLPQFVTWVLKVPMRLTIRKKRPEKKREVGLSIVVYAAILMGISLFWMDFESNKSQTAPVCQDYVQTRADSLMQEIRKPQPRRYRRLEPYYQLLQMGPLAYPLLDSLIKDNHPEIREFALISAREARIRESIPAMISSLNDPEFRVIKTAIRGLGEMKVTEAEDTLFSLLQHPPEGVRPHLILRALSQIGSPRIWPYLEEELKSDQWYVYSGALRSMLNIDPEAAKPYIYAALEDDEHLVRREAVDILLKILPEDALPHLQKVVNDVYWDVRFYAQQAVKLIQEKRKKIKD